MSGYTTHIFGEMFNRQLKLFAGTSFLIITLGSCKSEYEKLRTSNDNAKKYTEAVKLYNNGKYAKALGLFDPVLRRTWCNGPPPEELFYYYAYTNYKLKNYTAARNCFKNTADIYQSSPRLEEYRFMIACCEYLETPLQPFEQDKTIKAIASLQHFINLYPESDRAADAGNLIQKLHDKLAEKMSANAKMYFTSGNWQAAIVSIDNILLDYPDTKYAEELNFLSIRAVYEYARHSPEERRADRYNQDIGYAKQFIENYPASKYLQEVKNYIGYCKRGIATNKNLLTKMTAANTAQN